MGVVFAYSHSILACCFGGEVIEGIYSSAERCMIRRVITETDGGYENLQA